MRFPSVIVAVLLAFAAATIDAAAQDATPGTAVATVAAELRIRVTDAAIEVPEQIVAGRYLVVVENAITDPAKGISLSGDAGVDLLHLPENVTLEQVEADLDAPQPEGPGPRKLPDWAYEATWAGGPIAAFGGTAQTIVDLTPGEWAVLPTNLGSTQPPQPLTVTPGTSATPADAGIPDASAVVEMQDYAFVGLPAQASGARQVWQLSNSSEQPHMLALSRLPDGTTQEQLMTFLAQVSGGSPTPDGLQFEDFAPAPGIGYLSGGQTAWAVLDLEPGTYAALCFVPDRETGMPHVLMGMAAVITIGG